MEFLKQVLGRPECLQRILRSQRICPRPDRVRLGWTALLISASDEAGDWLDTLLELVTPSLSAVAVAGLGCALSRRVPLHMLLSAVAGTLPTTNERVSPWR